MRVLITGIDGFVGSHAAELFLQSSDEVHGTVIASGNFRNIAHLKNSVTLHQADITDAERFNELCRQIRPEKIVHLAGQAFVPDAMKNPMETFQANLLGGLSILEAARKQMVETGKSPSVLIVSSGEVYGRIENGQLPLTEQAPLQPNNPYAASKASIDMIARQYVQHFSTRVVVVRPFNHAGPRQSPAFVVSDFAKQFAEIAMAKREPVIHVGNISVLRDFTDVRDVVKAYKLLLEKQSDFTVFNVASAIGVEIKSLLDILKEISGIKVRIVQEPKRVRSYDIPVVIASYDRLREATGWVPTFSLRQTLQDVYNYWLEILGTDPPSVVVPSHQ